VAIGHRQPQYNAATTVEITTSSIQDGKYLVEAVCKNCTTWSLGSLDTTSTSQPFIFGLGPTGQTFSSDSTTANINQHSIFNIFTLDMQQAAISNTASSASNSAGALASGSGSGSSSGSASSSSAASTTYKKVHGIFNSIAFVILFPAGVILLRIFNSVLLHAICQALAFIFLIVGLGTGIYLSQNEGVSTESRVLQVFDF
jgi:hypothetical protein